MAIRFTLVFVLFVSTICCVQKNEKETNIQLVENDPIASTNLDKPLLNIEEAETIVSKFYSEQNRKAGYPLFKGLFLQIDSVNYNTDTAVAYINATVIGRKRISEKDTVTKAFEKSDTIQAILTGKVWTPVF